MKDKIRDFIMRNIINIEEVDELRDDDNIFQMGYVNSLFSMKLVSYIEKELDIELENEDINIDNFSSIHNIMDLIQRKYS